MVEISEFAKQIDVDFVALIDRAEVACDELTLDVPAKNVRQVCFKLRDEPDYHFDMLIDICGVDYLHYGVTEWETEQATRYGFDRGVRRLNQQTDTITCFDPNGSSHTYQDPPSQAPLQPSPKRFAVIYHLLSIKHNHRIRLRAFVEGEPPMIDSVHDIWASANWFERETFDLYGILFNGHVDLRRILTDYGFIGHPFRKDFPLSGQVEVRYDKDQQRVVYEPVDIEPRVLVPKIIRDDSRYLHNRTGESS